MFLLYILLQQQKKHKTKKKGLKGYENGLFYIQRHNLVLVSL